MCENTYFYLCLINGPNDLLSLSLVHETKAPNLLVAFAENFFYIVKNNVCFLVLQCKWAVIYCVYPHIFSEIRLQCEITSL